MKISADELAEDLMAEYRANGRKSLPDVKARWRLHLKLFFGGLRAVQVTTQLVDKYKARRRDEGAENATINRELAVLKRMFSIARRSTPPKVVSPPYIAMLKEDNVRKGFVEPADYDKLVSECARNTACGFGRSLNSDTLTDSASRKLLSMKVQQVDLPDRDHPFESGGNQERERAHGTHDSGRARIARPMCSRETIWGVSLHPR